MIRVHYMCAAFQRSGPIRPINDNIMEAAVGPEERLTVTEWRGGDTDCERGGQTDETQRTELGDIPLSSVLSLCRSRSVVEA